MTTLLTGCTTLRSNLNYNYTRDLESYGESVSVLVHDVSDARQGNSTLVGKFVGNPNNPNVGMDIHQPPDLFEKLKKIFMHTMDDSGFEVVESGDSEMTIKASLEDFKCSQISHYTDAYVKIHLLLTDSGSVIINDSYDMDHKKRHGLSMGMTYASFCNDSLQKATESIISEINEDIKIYMKS